MNINTGVVMQMGSIYETFYGCLMYYYYGMFCYVILDYQARIQAICW